MPMPPPTLPRTPGGSTIALCERSSGKLKSVNVSLSEFEMEVYGPLNTAESCHGGYLT